MYYTRKSKILHSINIGTKNNHLYFILVSAIALFVVMLLSFTPQAYAAEILCENTTLRGIITDDIRVPVDSRCLLKAFVQGDIFLEDNSLLDAYDSTIEGNIVGPDTSILLLNDSTLKGDIHVDGEIGIDGVGFDSLSVVGNILSVGKECVIITDAVIKRNMNDDEVGFMKKTVVIISNTSIDSAAKIMETDTNSVFCEGGLLEELSVELVENNISGDVLVEKSSNGEVSAISNDIVGSLIVMEINGKSTTVESNVVGKDLKVEKNFNEEGVLVNSNDVDGILDVKEISGKNTNVESNVVGKDLNVEKNSNEEGVFVISNNVDGILNVKEYSGKSTIVESNVVGKDLNVEKNVSDETTKVELNVVSENLKIVDNKNCSESNNQVDGNSEIKDCDL